MIDRYGLACTTCNRSYRLDTRDRRCECSVVSEFAHNTPFDPDQVDTARHGLCLYGATVPMDDTWSPVAPGEGRTRPARHGFQVEATSGYAVAAHTEVDQNLSAEEWVIVLQTGHDLRSDPVR